MPTANTRREYAKEGKTLPALVPPGPDNPMGLYAIYIGRLYAIHGTNANFGIGLRVSQGCIRLRNDDIKFLFDNVPVGTRVQLIDQPVKYSVEPDGSHWLEVHEPLSRNRAEFESDRKVPLPMTSALRDFTQGPGVSPAQVEQTLQRRSGMPVNISATAAQGSFVAGRFSLINGYCKKALLLSMHSTLLGIRIGKPILNLSAVAVMAFLMRAPGDAQEGMIKSANISMDLILLLRIFFFGCHCP
ncbi:L,D-transpeptidase ErfK [Klebsiella pneumoniae IS53]|nr:L,D-transpeptidase ErfK [Klebsiella pneumoniae IS53]